jgi:hypothetical protein
MKREAIGTVLFVATMACMMGGEMLADYGRGGAALVWRNLLAALMLLIGLLTLVWFCTRP